MAVPDGGPTVVRARQCEHPYPGARLACGRDDALRMNVPGTLGANNCTCRFEWSWPGAEPTRVLGLITAASGRAPIGLVGLPG